MMKKIFFFSLLTSILFLSCRNKPQPVENMISEQLETLDVQLNNIMLGSNFDRIDFDNLPRLTLNDYKSLQLAKVKGLEGYDTAYLSFGRVLVENEKGRIITIQVITDGEISEYLVSYDKEGRLVDNMIVAYEDMVEYYSRVSSSITSDKITVQTVNYTYSDSEGNPTETSDTATVSYRITPDFRFISD